jgi:hypothetical protein
VNSQGNNPILSVIILNYNGALWIEKCLKSIQQQTLFSRLEVIVADNASTDGSDKLSESILDQPGWAGSRFIQHGENLGYCTGNNRAAAEAHGEYLLFLNNDTRLEPDCLEILVKETSRLKADAAAPRIEDYSNNRFQSIGVWGFDLFGFPSTRQFTRSPREILMPEGCAYLIRTSVFHDIGEFDPLFFMYADEWDLSWRLWIAGFRAVTIPDAVVHHRGAAQVNPEGAEQILEFRTSDTKRFYSNRNGLLTLAKNAQHIFWILFILQFFYLIFELLISLLLVRRFSHVRRAYLDAWIEIWTQRRHIISWRRRIRAMRKRSDWWMLRFFKLRLNRWDEWIRMRQLGKPKINAK